MRRRILVLSAVLLTAGLVSSISLLTFFAEASRAGDLGESQGSFTEGRAGPNEASLVDGTGSGGASGSAGSVGTADVRPSGGSVVKVAKRYIGTDYKFGACTNKQMSCTCLTKTVYQKFGIKLPMSEEGQWKYKGGARNVAKSQLRAGDLVFFQEGGRKRGITHVGIYSGNGKLVHASAFFDRVVESKMKYIKGYYGAKRLKLR